MSDDNHAPLSNRLGRNPLYSPAKSGSPTRPVDASDAQDIAATADGSMASPKSSQQANE